MGVLEDAEALLKKRPVVTKAGVQNELTLLLAGLTAGWAVGAAPVVVSAGNAYLAALSAAAKFKLGLGALVSVMGTSTFINFISEEALQTAGMACFVAKGAQDAVALRAALDNYTALYKEAKKQGAITTWGNPFTKQSFDANLQGVASSIDSYEAALGAMKKTAGVKLAAQRAKAKVSAATDVAKRYEQNALDAMNAGDLKVGEQWLEKIVDASARLKARGRVVKAATKTHKALAASALKRADVAGARNEAALIPDDVARAAMLGKIDTFELKVAAKLQRAQEAAARKAVAAQNKAAQTAQRTAYFASLPEAQRPAWYAKAEAMAGAPGGAAEMAFGGVYYSAATGQYSVSTPSGLYHTSSASSAAAAAQAAGGKATAAGLAAGHPSGK